MNWNHKKYGFNVINWDFPEDDIPHCEVVFKINTGLEKIDEEIYSFTGCPLPWDQQLEFLENLKKSLDLSINKVKNRIKKVKD